MSTHRRPSCRLALCLAVSFLLGGCSFVFVKPLPPDYGPGDRLDCTDSDAPADLDIVLALLQVASIVYVSEKAGPNRSPVANLAIGSSGVWAVVHTSSAIYGYSKVSECGRAIAADAAPIRFYRRPPVLPPPERAAPLPPPPETRPAQPSPQQQDEDDPDHPGPRPLPPREGQPASAGVM